MVFEVCKYEKLDPAAMCCNKAYLGVDGASLQCSEV